MAMQRIFLTIILLLNCLVARGQNNVPVMAYTNGTLRSPTNFFFTNVVAGAGITLSFGSTNGRLTITMNGTNYSFNVNQFTLLNGTNVSISSGALFTNVNTTSITNSLYFTNNGPSDLAGAVTNWNTTRMKGNTTNDAILQVGGNFILNNQTASRLLATDGSKIATTISGANGQIPIGMNAGGYSLAAITAGNLSGVINGSGTITIFVVNTNITIWNTASSAATVPLTINSTRSDQSADLLDFVVNSLTLASVSAKGAAKFLDFTLNETANYTLLTTDVGSWVNNSGASGAVTNTLPAATLGYQFGLTVIAAQICTFKAVGSDTIRNAGSVSTAAGGITANTVGSHIHIYCPVAGQWIADSVIGSWTTF